MTDGNVNSLRLGAIDVGSNGLRFMAAEASGFGAPRLLESLRFPVRLGESAFSEGRLDQKIQRRALAALAQFKKRMAALRIQTYRAVATSAVRESANGSEFAALVRKRLGLNLEIISGSEEIRLVYLAIRRFLPASGKPWLLANLGGGSLEIALVSPQGIQWNETHTLGAVRVLTELRVSAGDPAKFARLARTYIATFQPRGGAKLPKLAGIMATGGNAEVLARLGQARESAQGPGILSFAQLQAVCRKLGKLPPEARSKTLALRPDRADVIFPAALVYERLCRLTGQRQLVIPFVGTKEGLVEDLAGRISGEPGYAATAEKNLLVSALALGHRYHFDEAHGRQVARISLSLFDQLLPLHGLGAEERRVLLAASLLHDIGMYISYKKHHKHSGYLLAQSELPGLGEAEMGRVALIARYHRKNGPDPKHPEYAALPGPDRRRVARLAAILRLADALDRDHAQSIRRVSVTVKPTLITLAVAGRGLPELDAWAWQRKAALFQKVFRRKVRWIRAGRFKPGG